MSYTVSTPFGFLPENWHYEKARWLFRPKNIRNKPNEPLLSVTQDEGVVLRSDREKDGMRVWNPTDDTSGYKLIEVGDFVISLRSFQGGIEFSNLRGIVSPAYTVLMPTDPELNHYYRWLLKSSETVAIFDVISQGIRQGRTISYEDFASVSLLVPPKQIGQAIAAFLDRETSRIDKLIEKKRRLIELLKEKRQAMISQAVTKGLDPNAKMRDSGIEWLGEIPEGWEVVRFGFCVRIIEGQVDPVISPYREMPLIAPNHIEGGAGRIIEKESAHEQGAISGKYLAQKGMVLYSKIRPHLNKACLADEECLISADMYALQVTDKDIDPEFVLLHIISPLFCEYMTQLSIRVAMPKVNRDDVKGYLFLKPPLKEQRRIAEYVNARFRSIEALLEKLTFQITLIQEYRLALITGAVTGKFDLRRVGSGHRQE